MYSVVRYSVRYTVRPRVRYTLRYIVRPRVRYSERYTVMFSLVSEVLLYVRQSGDSLCSHR